MRPEIELLLRLSRTTDPFLCGMRIIAMVPEDGTGHLMNCVMFHDSHKTDEITRRTKRVPAVTAPSALTAP
ncbi:hypothetical protein ACFT9I_16410 [Streptomyces sp. NPDC057137]|uniref:hypothetical protein n=1 Tax=Streptomyces sp. NPDC057137 TaxID=3346030 RepID=UPI003630B6AA